MSQVEQLITTTAMDGGSVDHAGAIIDQLDVWSSAIKHKSTTGRGSSKKIDLYGVKKLRELILELAVRGLLVPQDPNDEPASVLLVKITAEKDLLIKDGKIKKENKFTPISDKEKPFKIPKSWEWKRLTEVFYPISVSKNKIKTSEIQEQGILPVVDQGQSFIAGYIDDKNLEIELPGPVIIFGDHTSNLKYIDFNFVAGADGVKILRPLSIDEKYFYLVCQYLPIENRGYGRHYSRLIDNLFPLPPESEQSRIVTKVDELMALCDQLEQQQESSISAHQTLVETLLAALTNAGEKGEFNQAWARIADHFDTLFTTEHSIDQLKQTILQLAVMGKLVPQDPNDEPASVLLEKIAAEKAQLVKDKKIKKQKALPGIGEDEKPFELPVGWEYVRFAEIVNEVATGPFGSMIHKRDYIEGGIPLINPSHMINSQIVEDPNITVGQIKSQELKSYRLMDNDIVMARRGEMGRCALVTKREENWLCGTGSFVLRFQSHLSRKYILLLFKTQWVRDYLGGNSIGTTMTNLNHSILNKLPLLLPPLNEQDRIVNRVNELSALCEALKVSIKKSQTTQLHLADAMAEQVTANVLTTT